MTWWPWRRRPGEPTEDARHALEHTHRQMRDAQALGRAADDLGRRVDDVNRRWQETREHNGIAEAAIQTIMRKARHP